MFAFRRKHVGKFSYNHIRRFFKSSDGGKLTSFLKISVTLCYQQNGGDNFLKLSFPPLNVKVIHFHYRLGKILKNVKKKCRGLRM
jgi:hypothetical protein